MSQEAAIIPISLAWCLFMGTVIALLNNRRLSVEGFRPLGFATVLAGAYGLTYGLANAYFIIRWPDWALAYTIPSTAYPMAVMVVAYLSLTTVLAGMGAMASSAVLQREGLAFGLAFCLWSILIWLLLFTVLQEQYQNVTTMELWFEKFRPGRPDDFSRAFTILGIAQTILAITAAGISIKSGRKLVERNL